MPEQPYDRSGKWLLDHHGKALALLGGINNVVSAKSVQSETVQPRKLPDGLLELTIKGESRSHLLLVEICTYPEERTAKQLYDGIQLVRQARGVLPDALALILHPKGTLTVAQEHSETSVCGLSQSRVRWTVRTLWTMQAEEMLQVPDVGVVPWIPLMHFEGPPEPLFRRCLERIQTEGGSRRENLLVVTRSLATVKFKDPELLSLLLRSDSMLETPMTKEIYEMGLTARGRADIEEVILLRFGKLSEDSHARLQGITTDEPLRDLHRYAVVCKSKEEFVQRLNEVTTPTAKPKSSRGKRKS